MNRSIMMLVVVCLTAQGAAAQTSRDAPKPQAPATVAPASSAPVASTPPVAATPERTTASFGDWTLRCEVPPAPAKRVCEVALTITAQGQTAAAAQVALGKTSPTDAIQITAVLPPSVALLTKPQVVVSQADATPLDLIWQRCTPGACYAAVVMSDKAIALLTGQTEPGKILFKNAGDRDVVLPVSFRGLSQALQALLKSPD